MGTKLRALKNHSETGWASHRRQPRTAMFATRRIEACDRCATHRATESFSGHGKTFC
jgi:hypothetical protein